MDKQWRGLISINANIWTSINRGLFDSNTGGELTNFLCELNLAATDKYYVHMGLQLLPQHFKRLFKLLKKAFLHLQIILLETLSATSFQHLTQRKIKVCLQHRTFP